MTLGSHQGTVGKGQDHLTPRFILHPLGRFDLDPCAADPRPWDCADINFTVADDGLAQTWFGRVWLNPPSALYDDALQHWRRVEKESYADGARPRTEVLWLNPACVEALDAHRDRHEVPLLARDVAAPAEAAE